MLRSKTILAAAVLSAVSGVSFAAVSMPEIPTSFDEELTYNGSGLRAHQGEVWEEGKVALVAPGTKISTGSDSPIFLSTNYSLPTAGDVTNKGSIWVLAGDVNNTTYGKYAYGMAASTAGTTATNKGTIYVKASVKGFWSPNYESAVGMGADAASLNADGKAPQIVNNGTIVVDGGTAMKANSNQEGKQSVVINNGTISVMTGYGISLGGGNASNVTVSNRGTIEAYGSNAIALTTSDATHGVLTNAGTIIAKDGATPFAWVPIIL